MLEICAVYGWKAGIVKWKQRYRCKSCDKNQAETDGRVKKIGFSTVSGGVWISKNCENYE